jgi:plasmid maintenance system antidote protein VapI
VGEAVMPADPGPESSVTGLDTMTPGDYLRAALAERDMSQSYLAFATGYTLKHINQIVQGHVRLHAAVAAAIERETDIDARTLLYLQADVDLDLARSASVTDDDERRAEPLHGPHCTIGPGGVCMSAHCQWCGRPHSMWTACGCEWSKRKEVAPDAR